VVRGNGGGRRCSRRQVGHDVRRSSRDRRPGGRDLLLLGRGPRQRRRVCLRRVHCRQAVGGGGAGCRLLLDGGSTVVDGPLPLPAVGEELLLLVGHDLCLVRVPVPIRLGKALPRLT
jgi:hypothetical protein